MTSVLGQQPLSFLGKKAPSGSLGELIISGEVMIKHFKGIFINQPAFQVNSKSHLSSDQFTLVICCIQGIILPNHVGILISHYKDPRIPIGK